MLLKVIGLNNCAFEELKQDYRCSGANIQISLNKLFIRT